MGPPWSIWLRRSAWVRDELDWRSHVPILSDVKVERNCERCNFPRLFGAMLWWVRYANNHRSDDPIFVTKRQDWLVALQSTLRGIENASPSSLDGQHFVGVRRPDVACNSAPSRVLFLTSIMSLRFCSYKKHANHTFCSSNASTTQLFLTARRVSRAMILVQPYPGVSKVLKR
jgi:hypothetical protein